MSMYPKENTHISYINRNVYIYIHIGGIIPHISWDTLVPTRIIRSKAPSWKAATRLRSCCTLDRCSRHDWWMSRFKTFTPKHREKNKSWHLLVYDVWRLLFIIWGMFADGNAETREKQRQVRPLRENLLWQWERLTKKTNFSDSGISWRQHLEPNKTKTSMISID